VIIRIKFYKKYIKNKLLKKVMGERRGLNPRMMESQSIALPLGYARHLYNNFIILYIISSSNFPLFSQLLFTKGEK